MLVQLKLSAFQLLFFQMQFAEVVALSMVMRVPG